MGITHVLVVPIFSGELPEGESRCLYTMDLGLNEEIQ